MTKKLLFSFLFISPYFLIAQKAFTLQADYIRFDAVYGKLYFLHQKQAGYQVFYSNVKRKNNVFEQVVERKDTVSFPSIASAKDFFKPEERVVKQNIKELMSQLMNAAFEVENKTTKTVWQVMSKNIIAKSEYEKDTSNTYQLVNREYFHYIITVLNNNYPIVSIRESYDISEEVAALLPMKNGWKLCMDSLQNCKKITRLTDFIKYRHKYYNYYSEDEFSEFNYIFKKRGKFGLIDTNLQMIMIPPIYDSLFFLPHHIGCKKGKYLTFYNYFYEHYQAKNIRSAYSENSSYHFGGSLQILQGNEVRWLNLDGTVTDNLTMLYRFGSSCGGTGIYTRHFFKINQEKKDSSFWEYKQIPIREQMININVTKHIDKKFQELLKNGQIKPTKYELKIKQDSIYLYCNYTQNCEEKQAKFNLTVPLKSSLRKIQKSAQIDLLMLRQKKDSDSTFIIAELLFDTIQRFDISHIVSDGDLYFLNRKKEIEDENKFFQLEQKDFKINNTFVLVNKAYTKRSILKIDIVENKIKYEILAKDIDVIIPNKESNPIRFKQNKLYGFFPQNRKGEYEFLEDFIICFARFQKPNGKKGWLDIFGNEFLD